MKRGQLIKLLRFEKNLTQQQLADLTGLTKSSISRYESSQSLSMSKEAAAKLAEVLEVEAQWLLRKDDIPEIELSRSLKEALLDPGQLQNEQGRPKRVSRSHEELLFESSLPGEPKGLLVPFYPSLQALLQKRPEKYVMAGKLDFRDNPLEYFAIKAAPYYAQSGYKRRNLILHQCSRVEPGKWQLLEVDGKTYFGLVKRLNGVVAIRTELQGDQSLLLFDTKKKKVHALGTLAE